MVCEKCKHNEATVHLTEIIKNVKSEIHLCEVCAREIGLNSKLSNFNLSVPDMLSFLDVEEAGDVVDTNVCKTCGTTFFDYKKTGKLGCPDCYRYLRGALDAVIVSYHGEKKHIGKIPLNYVETRMPGKFYIESGTRVLEKTATVAELKKKLEDAVSDERYEEAAEIRDSIKKLEGGGF